MPPTDSRGPGAGKNPDAALFLSSLELCKREALRSLVSLLLLVGWCLLSKSGERNGRFSKGSDPHRPCLANLLYVVVEPLELPLWRQYADLDVNCLVFGIASDSFLAVLLECCIASDWFLAVLLEC